MPGIDGDLYLQGST